MVFRRQPHVFFMSIAASLLHEKAPQDGTAVFLMIYLDMFIHYSFSSWGDAISRHQELVAKLHLRQAFILISLLHCLRPEGCLAVQGTRLVRRWGFSLPRTMVAEPSSPTEVVMARHHWTGGSRGSSTRRA